MGFLGAEVLLTMPPQLVAEAEDLRIVIDKPILLMGRDAECDIQFESRKISRRHCCIAQVGEQLVIRDLGSTNGIRINGVRVLEGYLKGGDELAIGNHRYQVRWEPLPAGQEKKAVRKIRDVKPAPGFSAPPDASEQLSASADLPSLANRIQEQPFVLPEDLVSEPPQAASPARTPTVESTALEPEPPLTEPQPFHLLPEDIKLTPATDDIPLVVPRRPRE